MSAKAFRVLHYSPDPTSGARYPVAAVAKSDEGVRVFLAPHVPGDECLGAAGRARFIHRIQQRLMKVDTFDNIHGLGPYCELSAPVELQEDAGWEFVERLVAGWHATLPKTIEGVHVSRRAEGHRWLSAHHVDKFVKRQFRPGNDFGGFLGHAMALEAVSQYVPGVESLVLMEPLTLRPRIEDDIRKVAQRFGAYSAALNSRIEEGPQVEMVVYLLPGLGDKLIERTIRDVSYSSAKVYSVDNTAEKAKLLSKIRSVAAESNLIS